MIVCYINAVCSQINIVKVYLWFFCLFTLTFHGRRPVSPLISYNAFNERPAFKERIPPRLTRVQSVALRDEGLHNLCSSPQYRQIKEQEIGWTCSALLWVCFSWSGSLAVPWVHRTFGFCKRQGNCWLSDHAPLQFSRTVLHELSMLEQTDHCLYKVQVIVWKSLF
jgi:hypothetical protein